MGLRTHLCIAILLRGFFLDAQNQGADIDTLPFRTTFPDKIAFRVAGQNAANRFVFRAEDGSSIRYRPVNRNILKISAQFRALDLGFGITPAFINPERNQENARLRNFNFRLFLGRWMQTFDFYDQRGHFGDVEGREVYLPGLESRKFGGSTAYVFNRNFSFRALVSQNEWQRRSAGSFVPRVVAYYTRYKFVEDSSVFRVHSYDLALGPGYHYNWVVHPNILLSIGNTTGIGLNVLEDEGETSTSLLWETVFRGGLSYNSNRFFAGVDLSYAFLEHGRVRDVRIDDRIYFGQLYVGYRIQAPKKWVATAEKVNRKFGMEP